MEEAKRRAEEAEEEMKIMYPKYWTEGLGREKTEYEEIKEGTGRFFLKEFWGLEEWKFVHKALNQKVCENNFPDCNMCSVYCEENTFNILKLERVHNEKFWRNFQNELKIVKDKHEKYNIKIDTPMTKYMFHSTGKSSPLIILEGSGFDIKYSGKGNFFGEGIYFSDYADYSHYDSNGLYRYVCEGEKNKFQIIMANVITGLTCRGKEGLLKPKVHKEYGIEWDSMTDSFKGGPIMNCVFENRKVYPSYLITYEQSNTDDLLL